MPNIKSAKKRVIVNNKRADRNKSRNTALKTAIKKLMPLLSQTLPTKKFLLKLQLRKSTRLLQRVLFI